VGNTITALNSRYRPTRVTQSVDPVPQSRLCLPSPRPDDAPVIITTLPLMANKAAQRCLIRIYHPTSTKTENDIPLAAAIVAVVLAGNIPRRDSRMSDITHRESRLSKIDKTLTL